MLRTSACCVAVAALAQFIPSCPVDLTGGNGNVGGSTPRGEIATAASGPADAQNYGTVVALSATASGDAAGGEISYSWVQTGGIGVKLNNANTANPTFQAPSVGEDSTLTFLVTTRNEAGDVGRASASVLIAARPGGVPGGPVARAGADRSVRPGAAVTLNGGASTGTGLTYAWSQISGSPLVTLTNASAAQTSFTAPGFVEGSNTFTFQLTVRDGQGREARDTVVITVNQVDPNAKTKVRMRINRGDVVIELEDARAPITVQNFLRYVDDGFYVNTRFHRVVKDFVVQGGGFDQDLVLKETREPIVNEAGNGLSNVRGTIAMARTSSPNSATSQFYFNLVDNSAALDPDGSNAGYAVFGKVIQGMEVIDGIGALEVTNVGLPPDMLEDVPLEVVYIISIERIE